MCPACWSAMRMMPRSPPASPRSFSKSLRSRRATCAAARRGRASGSGFGLDAPGGAQAWLREHGRGFALGPVVVPIVPGAILFDLTNGGNKDWGRFPPYRDLGYAATAIAGNDFALGTAGAGYGAKTVNLKGGLGSASATTRDGAIVGAIAAVNALGSVTVGDSPHFWAAPFEQNGEFGGGGLGRE